MQPPGGLAAEPGGGSVTPGRASSCAAAATGAGGGMRVPEPGWDGTHACWDKSLLFVMFLFQAARPFRAAEKEECL